MVSLIFFSLRLQHNFLDPIGGHSPRYSNSMVWLTTRLSPLASTWVLHKHIQILGTNYLQVSHLTTKQHQLYTFGSTFLHFKHLSVFVQLFASDSCKFHDSYRLDLISSTSSPHWPLNATGWWVASNGILSSQPNISKFGASPVDAWHVDL